MVVPGSHRTFIQCAGKTPEDNYKSSLKEQEAGVPAEDDVTKMASEHGIDQFTGRAGTALWFDSNILRGSGNNISPYPCPNIFVVFNSVETRWCNRLRCRSRAPGTSPPGISRRSPDDFFTAGRL